MNFLLGIQSAGCAMEKSVQPFLRVAGLWLAMQSVVSSLAGSRKMSHFQKIQAGEPRALLLAGVEVLMAVPWVLLWLMLGYSFVRHPGFHHWMLGAGLVGFLSTGVLLVTSGVSNLQTTISLMMSMGHVGFGLGYAFSVTSFARRLDPTLLRRSKPAKAATAAEPTGSIEYQTKDGIESEGSSTTQLALPPKTSHLSDATLVCPFLLLWFSAGLCQTIAQEIVPDFSKSSPEELSGIQLLLTMAALVGGLPLYALVAYFYPSNTKDAIWDCAGGLFLGGSSLALLRCTALDSTWQSWAIDCGLAFVGVHIGLVGGLFLRCKYDGESSVAKEPKV